MEEPPAVNNKEAMRYSWSLVFNSATQMSEVACRTPGAIVAVLPGWSHVAEPSQCNASYWTVRQPESPDERPEAGRIVTLCKLASRPLLLYLCELFRRCKDILCKARTHRMPIRNLLDTAMRRAHSGHLAKVSRKEKKNLWLS